MTRTRRKGRNSALKLPEECGRRASPAAASSYAVEDGSKLGQQRDRQATGI